MPIQARTEFAAAINQIASEKGVETDVILDAIQQAALAAYKKDLSFRNEPLPDDVEELIAKLDPATGEISIWRGEANITPPGFARIAAQTAKQVITQKLHEAEKGAIVDEYEQKVGTVVSGSIQRQEGNTFFVDLGRAEGILPPSEQVRDEYYAQNQRMKFYIKEIREDGRGPEVIVSRSDANLVKGLFAMEVPEIQSSAVEIRGIAREAGGRTKVAVISNQDGVDPVGSLVGQKGVRVQSVINELGEEKIDIVLFSEDISRYIAAALSPAKDISVALDEETKVAKVSIPSSQLSLAIGKGGQNVRLAAKLTGWKIDIEGTGEEEGVKEEVSNVSEEPKVEVSEDNETEETKVEVDSDGDSIAALQNDNEIAEAVVDGSETPAEVVEQVEEKIDEAMANEATVDAGVVEEPTAEEAAPAAAQAEADMQEADADEKVTEGTNETEETKVTDETEETEVEEVEEIASSQAPRNDDGDKEENSGDQVEDKKE